MKRRYENRLKEILDKYECKAPAIADGQLINSIVLDVFNRRCGGKTAVIWGVGKKNAVNSHCAVIINRYILNLTGLKCLIDSDKDIQGDLFMGYPVIDPSEINNNDIDIIIIASKGSRKSIRDNIQKIAPQCEYIDIYEELERAGVKIDYNFFSEDSVTVIMADHSQPVYDKTRNDPFFMFCNDPDRVSHVAFMVSAPWLKAGIYDSLVSMLDFNSIMKKAVFEHEVFVPERKIVQYQFCNVQNRRLREVASQRGLMDYTEGIQCFLSKEYLYVKTAIGKEEVYALPDCRTNVIDSKGAKAYLEYVEKHFETGFPDFWTIRDTVF